MKTDKHKEKATILIAETTIKIVRIVCLLSVAFLYSLLHINLIKPNLTENNIAAVEKSNLQNSSADFKDGIHIATGLMEDENVNLIISNCTACHSAKLVTQNKATEQGWRDMIKWMQETQNLWDLGENENKIVRYLAKNYGPQKISRRTNRRTSRRTN